MTNKYSYIDAYIPTSHYVRFAAAALQQLFVAGAVFGFPSLVVGLKKQKVYADLCHDHFDESGSCDTAETRLNWVFTAGCIGSFMGALVGGWVMDTMGPRVTAVAGHVLTMLGAIGFGVAANPSPDLFPEAFALIGFGGSFVQVGTLHVSNEFSAPSGVMSLFSGLYAASSGALVIMNILLEHGTSYEKVFLGYALLILLNGFVALLVTPRTVPIVPAATAKATPLLADADLYDAVDDGGIVPDGTESPNPLLDHRLATESEPLPNHRSSFGIQQSGGLANTSSSQKQHRMLQSTAEEPPPERAMSAVSSVVSGFAGGKAPVSKGTPFKDDLFSGRMAVIAYYMAVHVLRINFYVGTGNLQLAAAAKHSNTSVHSAQTLFHLFLPLGALGVPFVGILMEKAGLAWTLLVFEFATLFWIVPSLMKSLEPQYLTVVVVTMLRPFNFGYMFAYVNTFFDGANFGRVLGLVSVLGGVVSLLDHPLLVVTQHDLDHNFQRMNLYLFFAGLPLFFAPLAVNRFLKKAGLNG